MQAVSLIVKLTNTVAFLCITIYAIWGAALFDLGYHTVAIPIQNMAALLIPVGLYYRPPPKMNKLHDVLFCIFAVIASLTTVVLTLSWWMGRFAAAYPEPSEAVDKAHDEFRGVVSIFSCIAALTSTGVALLVRRSRFEETMSIRRGAVFRFLRVAAWALCIREIILACYMIAYPTPLLAPTDSAIAILIVSAVAWLVVPNVPPVIAVPLLMTGIGLNIATWVMDIRRTETVSVYLSPGGYFKALDEARSINGVYMLGPTDLEYCASMSVSYQLSTMYWIALNMAILVGVIPVPEKRDN